MDMQRVIPIARMMCVIGPTAARAAIRVGAGGGNRRLDKHYVSTNSGLVINDKIVEDETGYVQVRTKRSEGFRSEDCVSTEDLDWAEALAHTLGTKGLQDRYMLAMLRSPSGHKLAKSMALPALREMARAARVVTVELGRADPVKLAPATPCASDPGDPDNLGSPSWSRTHAQARSTWTDRKAVQAQEAHENRSQLVARPGKRVPDAHRSDLGVPSAPLPPVPVALRVNTTPMTMRCVGRALRVQAKVARMNKIEGVTSKYPELYGY